MNVSMFGVMRAKRGFSATDVCVLPAEQTALRLGLEQAQQWNREMVEKAASGGVLDGYRELGARAAAAENERDALRSEVSRLKETINRDTITIASQAIDIKHLGG